jgi:hypothetical protein
MLSTVLIALYYNYGRGLLHEILGGLLTNVNTAKPFTLSINKSSFTRSVRLLGVANELNTARHK